MKILSANRNLLVSIAVIILLLAGGYWYVNNGSSADTSVLSSTAPVANDSLLSTLTELRSLTLDSTVFSSPTFKALTDNTVMLPTVPAGRPNPFAGLAQLILLAQQQANGGH